MSFCRYSIFDWRQGGGFSFPGTYFWQYRRVGNRPRHNSSYSGILSCLTTASYASAGYRKYGRMYYIISERQLFLQSFMQEFSNFTSFGPSAAESIVSETQSEGWNSPKYFNLAPMIQSLPVEPNLRKISIDLEQQMALIEGLHRAGSTIKVFCRFKPSQHPLIQYDNSVAFDGFNHYAFDGICGQFATQEEVYDKIAKSHVSDFLAGLNSTVFAYGQTSSGKTYTMFGEMASKNEAGIIPRALQDIFSKAEDGSQVTCSMLEIYKQRLKDLFSCENSELKIKESGEETFVEGLLEVSVEDKNQLIDLITYGHGLRKVAHTYTNDHSSRSHTVVFINLVKKNGKRSKLSLIDLAGSQKVSRTGATGETLEEAKKINLSLSCLGNVIHSLTTGAEHVPFRDSKLTRILRDSLSGDCRTSIVTTCSLDKGDKLQTISTMKFAVRAKKIKARLRVDRTQQSAHEIIRSLQKQLLQARKELEKYRTLDKQLVDVEDVPEEDIIRQPLKVINYNNTKSRGNSTKSCYHEYI